MIRALLTKELREFLPISAVGLLGAGGAALLARRPFSYPFDIPIPLLDRDYLYLTMSIAAGVALLLGLAMSWKEEWRHTWPFLLHRPATRLQILTAKQVAGTLLVGLVFLPYLLLAVWCGIPGKCPAPWNWSYLLPGLLIALLAEAVFLAAFAAGLRSSARWYGSRLTALPGVLALFVGFAALSRVDAAVLTGIVSLGLLAATAWVEWRPSVWARLAATVTHGVGISVVLCVGGLIGLGVLAALRPAPELPAGPPARGWNPIWHSIEFRRDGELFVVGKRPAGEIGTGMTLSRATGEAEDPGNFVPAQMAHRIPSGFDRFQPRGSFQPFLCVHVPVERWEALQSAYRYTLGNGVVVDYDPRSRRRLGAWGRNGFFRDPAAAEGFGAGAACAGDYVAGPHGIFRLAPGRTVQLVDQPGDSSRPLLVWVGRTNDVSGAPYDALFLTATEIVACLPGSDTPRRFPLPPEIVGGRRAFDVSVLADGGVGLSCVLHDKPTTGRDASQEGAALAWAYDGSGTLRWRRDVVLPGPYLDHVVWQADRPRHRAASGFMAWWRVYDAIWLNNLSENCGDHALLGILSSPLVVGATMGLTALAVGPNESDFSHMTSMSDTRLAGLSLAVAVLTTLAAAALAWCYLRGRGRRPAACLGWALVALVGGVPFLLAIIALHGGERRIPCPSCAAPRFPSLAQCPRCGTGWPPPRARDTDLLIPGDGLDHPETRLREHAGNVG